jgi:hypothetical protein
MTDTTLTFDHPRWQEFADAIETRTPCDHSHTHTRAALRGIDVDEDASITWLESKGGYCDCEVMLNVVLGQEDTMTKYYGNFAIPGQEERLLVGPEDSPAGLVGVYRAAALFFKERGVAREYLDYAMRYHWLAKKGGVERELTAAVTAAFEKKLGGKVKQVEAD